MQMQQFVTHDGLPLGVLIRDRQPTSLRTLMAYVDGPGDDATLYEVESRIEFDSADPFTWTHAAHRDGDEFHDVTRPADAPADSLPSYAATCLIEQLARGAGDGEISYTTYDEVDRTFTPSLARRDGDQVVLRTGRILSVHDIADGHVSQSQWGRGFVSRGVTSQDDLLKGLPKVVEQRAARFLAGEGA